MNNHSTNPQPNFVDRAVGFFSPQKLYERMAWKVELALRSYDAGGWDRSNDGWHAINQPGVLMDRSARDTVRARAQDLERNSDMLESMIKASVRNVVGTGFKLQAKVKDKKGDDSPEINTALESLWNEWCKARNCDVQGRLSFPKMCRMAQRRFKVDGGILFVKCYTDGGLTPFKLQLREVSELDTTVTSTKLKSGNYLVDGIETDAYGKHVNYYFRRFSPDGFTALNPDIIPASRVIYMQNITRPTQVREMSPLAACLSRIRDVNGYIEALNVQARVAACFAAIIKKVLPGGVGLGRGNAGSTTDSKSGYGGQTVTPGMLYQLQPGEDVSTLSPPTVGSSAREMVSMQQRMAGAGQGLSYEAASRDMSQVNYSSARQGRLEDEAEYQQEKQDWRDQVLYEIYTEFLIAGATAGILPFTINELLADKSRLMAHIFYAKGSPWIDPMKEAMANKIALETGQTTLAQIAAERGGDWQEIIAQRGRELAAMQAVGMIIVGGDASATNTATTIAAAGN